MNAHIGVNVPPVVHDWSQHRTDDRIELPPGTGDLGLGRSIETEPPEPREAYGARRRRLRRPWQPRRWRWQPRWRRIARPSHRGGGGRAVRYRVRPRSDRPGPERDRPMERVRGIEPRRRRL